ncbi:MAG: sigma-70 family RNA polymerase sigma factor [Planctomycetota bacterium]
MKDKFIRKVISDIQSGLGNSKDNHSVLWKLIEPFLIGTIKRLLKTFQSSFSENDLNDLLQDTYEIVYKKAKKYDTNSQAKFTTFVYLGIKDLIKNWLKRKNEDDNFLRNDYCHEVARKATPSNLIIIEYADAEKICSRILEALKQIPNENYRLAFEYYYFKQLSYEAIAKVLARPISTIKSDLLRAKEEIRDIILKDKALLNILQDLNMLNENNKVVNRFNFDNLRLEEWYGKRISK